MSSTPGVGTGTGSNGHEQPSLGELLGRISEDVSTLMRQEVALAKAELSESATRAGKGAGMLTGAGVAGHMVLVFLSISLWWGLGHLIDLGWSALVVAVIWGAVAAVLALKGRAEITEIKGAPRTMETAKKIPDALQGHEERNR
ncbi:phage holin family protein [Actinotalea sp. BY-33]|uniref:Phage holin family protein n=1 Tax=Actinotalea soli TaxID=2819234 RepID=A0A939LPR0_9CELL|nr:phage holin family protein [Actinotalea soli]MBO1751679.1 phage holin family protein [Actinotalea soli]